MSSLVCFNEQHTHRHKNINKIKSRKKIALEIGVCISAPIFTVNIISVSYYI